MASENKQLEALVDWTIEHMVNRLDACGGYYRSGDTTVPTTRKQSDPRWTSLPEMIARHFTASSVNHLVGLHSTSPDQTSKWLAFDIDAHDDKADKEANLMSALDLREKLIKRGFTPHLFDSNGAGGYHLFVFFEESAPTHRVYELGHILAKPHKNVREWFPKQPSIKPDGYGNWLRLPGRHHKRDHFTKYFDGERWLSNTFDYLLTIDGDPINGLPDAEKPRLRVVTPDDSEFEATASEIAIVIDKLKKQNPAIEGDGGDDTTYRVCCMVVRDHGLSVDQAMIAMSDWNARCDPPWPADELRKKLIHAKQYGNEPIGAAPAERNFGAWGTTDNTDDKPPTNVGKPYATTDTETDGNTIRVPAASTDNDPKPFITNAVAGPKSESGKQLFSFVPIQEITKEVLGRCDNWPKRLGGDQLFVEESPSENEILPSLRFFKDTNQFFAWFKSVADVHWMDRSTVAAQKAKDGLRSCITKTEFFEHLRQTLNGFTAYGGLPHYPARDDLYYPEIDLPEPTGDCLREFVASLNAETELDRGLLLAALLTPLWGGEPGSRPAFIFTSQHGRGVGKTTTAEVFADLYGGGVTWKDEEKPNEFYARLLGDLSLQQRICIRDNAKGRIEGATLESMITSKWLDGKRMYHGQFRRPNLMTWYITANTPELSRDIADRSYIIAIGGQKHKKDWRTWAFNFIRDNQRQLLADLYGILKGEDAVEIERPDRWSAWQRGVLAKLPGANEIIELNFERREAFDNDKSQAEEIEECIEDELINRGHDRTDCVWITNDLMFEIMRDNHIAKTGWTKGGTMQMVASKMSDLGSAARLVKKHRGELGRGWLWCPDAHDIENIKALRPKDEHFQG